ncbi:MAG TPA: HupE/UreJ family protein, partial [Myxococcaceae bacterium]|nr:HupE/UreJ family protein [Myxococcaceae bacterium]
AMAGIEPDHANTDDSPNAPVYDDLRALGPDALRDAFSGFEERFLQGVSLATEDGTPVALSVLSLDVPDAPDLSLARHSEVTLSGRLPEGAEALVWRYDPSFGASVVRLQGPGEEEVTYSEFLQAGSSSQPIAIEGVAQSARQVLTNYVEAGFLHVLPLGLDHILFVVGLFLLSPRFRPLLWQVSAFTLAHTITLALGATGTVVLPSAPVEILIAASIAYVAIENLFTSRLHPWRPALVFGFGLLHGLGFAGVLAEFGLPENHFVLALVAFNIGVELAQLTVIGLCFLAVGWAMNRTWYRPAIVAPVSVAIAAMAFYWMLERGGLLT